MPSARVLEQSENSWGSHHESLLHDKQPGGGDACCHGRAFQPGQGIGGPAAALVLFPKALVLLQQCPACMHGKSSTPRVDALMAPRFQLLYAACAPMGLLVGTTVIQMEKSFT